MAGNPLADRVRSGLKPLPVTEQSMFGGICFMLNGNMLVGASPRGLLVRVGKADHERALTRPHARPMQQANRSMPGYIVVAGEGVAKEGDLKSWLDLAVAHVSTLPPKTKKPAVKKPRTARTKPK